MWRLSGCHCPSSGLSKCVWVAFLVSLRGSSDEGVSCRYRAVVFGGAACERKKTPPVLVGPDVDQMGQLCEMVWEWLVCKDQNESKSFGWVRWWTRGSV